MLGVSYSVWQSKLFVSVLYMNYIIRLRQSHKQRPGVSPTHRAQSNVKSMHQQR